MAVEVAEMMITTGEGGVVVRPGHRRTQNIVPSKVWTWWDRF